MSFMIKSYASHSCFYSNVVLYRSGKQNSIRLVSGQARKFAAHFLQNSSVVFLEVSSLIQAVTTGTVDRTGLFSLGSFHFKVTGYTLAVVSFRSIELNIAGGLGGMTYATILFLSFYVFKLLIKLVVYVVTGSTVGVLTCIFSDELGIQWR